MKKIYGFILMACALLVGTGCERDEQVGFREDFIRFVEAYPEMKELLVESIEKCKTINPDKKSNPVQSLEEYYDFVEWSTRCMPWEVLQNQEGHDLFLSIDQSLNYFYWLVDQPLDELKYKDYYRPTLQYHEPFRSWLIDYTREWGSYLSTPASWNDEYLQMAMDNERFGLSKGWYEDPSNWHSYNDFFARHLSSPAVRPIAEPSNDALICSPADCEPQGIWQIDDQGEFIVEDGVVIKSRRFISTMEMLGKSKYRNDFKNGTMTHAFLNVDDYHRYHFPVTGEIVEILNIPGDEAVGGYIEYDPATVHYVLHCDEPTWQAIETRSVAVIKTEKYGLVAVMPIGMSQICACMWEDNVKVGKKVQKGDPMGYFLFGGSDIVMLFQENVDVEMVCPAAGTGYQHLLMGEPLVRLTTAK